ncbi:MAG: LysE family translocator [Pseudomonadota bacterium]
MLFSDATAYALSLITLTLAPGPLVLLLMVRAAGNDRRGAIGFGLGVAAGDILVIAAICLGFGTWLQSAPGLYEFGKVAMLLYVGWLAWGIWKGGFDIGDAASRKSGGVFSAFFAGCTTCIISPQTIVLYTLFLPRLVNVAEIDLALFALISAITFGALAACFAIVIAFAAKLRDLAHNPIHVVTVNRSLATVLCGAGVWMVAA